METEILSQRIRSGLAEAKRKGKVLGRPKGSTDKRLFLKKYPHVIKELKAGTSIRKTAKLCDCSTGTVNKVKGLIS